MSASPTSIASHAEPSTSPVEQWLSELRRNRSKPGIKSSLPLLEELRGAELERIVAARTAAMRSVQDDVDALARRWNPSRNTHEDLLARQGCQEVLSAAAARNEAFERLGQERGWDVLGCVAMSPDERAIFLEAVAEYEGARESTRNKLIELRNLGWEEPDKLEQGWKDRCLRTLAALLSVVDARPNDGGGAGLYSGATDLIRQAGKRNEALSEAYSLWRNIPLLRWKTMLGEIDTFDRMGVYVQELRFWIDPDLAKRATNNAVGVGGAMNQGGAPAGVGPKGQDVPEGRPPLGAPAFRVYTCSEMERLVAAEPAKQSAVLSALWEAGAGGLDTAALDDKSGYPRSVDAVDAILNKEKWKGRIEKPGGKGRGTYRLIYVEWPSTT